MFFLILIILYLHTFHSFSSESLQLPWETSHLIHEDFQKFLVEHQLLLCSELAHSCTASSLDEKRRENFKAQLRTVDAKIMQLEVDPRNLTVLGVDATAGLLGKFLAAVLGSLLSGLMKQAAESD